MTLLPNNEDFSQASGIINMPFLEAIYHSTIDELMLDLGRTITLHLTPLVEQDTVTQSQPAAQQYNPFFGRAAIPNTNTRNPGVRVTHQDVQYRAQIVFGPLRAKDDKTGMGDLKEDEAQITVAVEALPHIQQTLSVSIEGRRFSIAQTKPTGFSQRRYLMCKLKEIQETEQPNPDITIG